MATSMIPLEGYRALVGMVPPYDYSLFFYAYINTAVNNMLQGFPFFSGSHSFVWVCCVVSVIQCLLTHVLSLGFLSFLLYGRQQQG